MPDHTTDHEPELLTITEAAELLRAPVATLRYWRHRNIGPRSFRLGRRVLYRRDDLHAWIDKQHDQVAGARRPPNAEGTTQIGPVLDRRRPVARLSDAGPGESE